MNKLLFSLLLLILTTGCQAMGKSSKYDEKDALPEGLTLCPEQRSSICTREFMPVCGYIPETQTWKTYSNKCVACSDHAVIGYKPGPCEDDGSEQLKKPQAY